MYGNNKHSDITIYVMVTVIVPSCFSVLLYFFQNKNSFNGTIQHCILKYSGEKYTL